MPDESLLTPEVRAYAGRTSEPVRVRVSARAVRRAIETYGGRRREFAEGDEVPGIVTVALEAESEPIAMPEVLPRSLLISNEMSFERPLRLGEELTVRQRIADISERLGGRFGYSIYVRSETEFFDASGQLVASTARTMMQYEHEARGEDGD
ncbi:MAG: MaoC family dehydratase N-terminal domain-containing protein [Hyphomicrobiales bacterium]